MKFPLLALVFLLSFSQNLSAQNDSIDVVKTKWTTTKIAPGVKLRVNWFDQNLFNSNQNVSIVEVKSRRRNLLDLAYSRKELIRTDEFGKKENAIVALNGTFFDIANGGSVDFIKSDHVIINDNQLGKTGERSGHQTSAVLINDGKLSIAKWDGNAEWEKSLTAEDVMVSGPLLIFDEQLQHLDSNSFNITRHPRTAIAITKQNRVLLITVDGRNEMAAGMNLFELGKMLRWLGASEAINLDGGGSTALWIDSKSHTGIINYPSDNKKWDHEGARKVANVILLKRK